MSKWVDKWTAARDALFVDPTSADTLERVEQILRAIGQAVAVWFPPASTDALRYPGRAADRAAIERWDGALTECARALRDPDWSGSWTEGERDERAPIDPRLAARERAILLEWTRRATFAGVALAAYHASMNRGDHQIAALDLFTVGLHLGAIEQGHRGAFRKMRAGLGRPHATPADDAKVLERFEVAQRKAKTEGRAAGLTVLAEQRETGASASTIKRAKKRTRARDQKGLSEPM